MGQYLHLFETENEFEGQYYSNSYKEPWVSLTNTNNPHVDYNKVPPVIPQTNQIYYKAHDFGDAHREEDALMFINDYAFKTEIHPFGAHTTVYDESLGLFVVTYEQPVTEIGFIDDGQHSLVSLTRRSSMVGVEELYLPNSVTFVNSLYDLGGLKKLVIGSGVTSIDYFGPLGELETLQITASAAPSVNQGTFGRWEESGQFNNMMGHSVEGDRIVLVPGSATGYDQGYWNSVCLASQEELGCGYELKHF